MSNSDSIVVTLIRGKKYTIFQPGTDGRQGVYHEFQRSVPVEVSPEVADLCEAEIELVRTTDKENPQDVEMDRFKVERGAVAPAKVVAPPKMRLKMVAAAPAPVTRTAPPARTGIRPISLRK